MPEVPKALLHRIQEAFLEYRYLLRVHGHERMNQRNIAPLEIREIVLSGEAIEYDAPGERGIDASVLFSGRVSSGRPLHVKVVEAQNVRSRVRHFVVTVYEPNIRAWSEDFRFRR
ncbi:MAG: DUF4258 domain-containing protein [Pleurocapsa sp. SU_196_0]|nr:DUF4258 domain-containing protein [Pleurocapsa sp. SU_196_0]